MKFFCSPLLALVLVATGAQAQGVAPFTAVSLQSDTPANVPPSGFLEARPPDWSFFTYRNTASDIRVSLFGPEGKYLHLFFRAPPGATLAPGAYESAYFHAGASPQLSPTGNVACDAPSGRFVVHELAQGTDGAVTTFAASFESSCLSGSPLYGDVRVNSTLPLPSMVTAPDTSPDAFALEAQMPVRAGALVTSNWISVLGVNRPVPVSIIGGEYSLNGAPFTVAAGNANLHDDIVVQMVASRVPGATRRATLTVGGRSATLHARTYEPGTALTGLYYQSTSGDYVGQGQTRLYLAPPNIVEMLRYDWGPVIAGITGVAGATWRTMMVGTGNSVVVPGVYEGASKSATTTSPGLDVGGDGRGCNQTSGRFVVHEAVYAVDGTPQRFAADFEQYCETTGPPLLGELRFNSTVPMSPLVGGACSPGDADCAAPLSNISTRGRVMTGNDVMIGGFFIGGSTSKTVVVRARGPSLAAFGITNPLLNPQLQLVRSSDQATIAINDDWGSAPNAAAVSASGFAPSVAQESAILVTLPPGAYTAIVSGVGGGTGIGIIEVFEVDHPMVPLANISTRGSVRTGDDVMIGGFVVQGTEPRTVVIRARGPSLAPFGITNPLANPALQLVRSSDQAPIAFDDDWGSAANAADITASGFAPANGLESAILITLQPGAYTAIVSGAGGTTGVGIVEVFPLL